MKTTANKRLLVLGGAIQHLQVVKAAKDLGVYVIVTDNQKRSEVKGIADEALEISVMDSEALIDWCEKNSVDGVLDFSIDFAQHSHQKLCERFGFPGYGSKEQYDCLTDKLRFKKLCRDNHVDVIPDYDENHLDRVEFPVLVKPAESSGSRGAVICQSMAELQDALVKVKHDSRNGKVIIEKYMVGYPDIEIAYFVNKGVPHLMWAGDRYSGKKEDGLHRQCAFELFPTRFIDSYLKYTHPRICRMIQNLGLNTSPVFFQGFVDGDTVRLYDPGIRFPGDEFGTVLKTVTGIDVMRAMVIYALTGDSMLKDEDIDHLFGLNGCYGALYMLQANPGTISKLEGMEEIRKLPSVVTVTQRRFAGDTILDTGDLSRRVGEVAIVGTGDIQSIVSSTKEVTAHLKMEDEKGGNMFSAFDSDRLLNLGADLQQLK